MKHFPEKEVRRSIEAINKKAIQVWVNAFAREPRLQQSYYWTLFSEFFLKQLHNISVSMSGAGKMIPQLSASQARCAIHKAKDLEVTDTGEHAKYVKFSAEREELIHTTSSKALQNMKEIFAWSSQQVRAERRKRLIPCPPHVPSTRIETR